MNKLEATILDQHARVHAAGEKGHEVLGKAKGEVLGVATSDYVQEILTKTLDVAMLAQDPASSHLGGVRGDESLPRKLSRFGSDLYTLSDSRFIMPDQGYVGYIPTDASGVAYAVYGFTTARGQQLGEEDLIQEACGPDFFYPPMMWAKALYSEAYNNRPDSQGKLSIQVWLAELAGEGLSQGSNSEQSGLLGATGFMPSAEMMAKLNDTQAVKKQIESEPAQEFRASGLMDQVALTHLIDEDGISWEDTEFMAKVIIGAGGSLN